MKTFKVNNNSFLCEEFDSEKYAAPVDSMNNPAANTISEAKKQLNEASEKAKIDEAKNQLMADEYAQARNALNARNNKKMHAIEVEYLKMQTEENKKYASGDVDTMQHRKNLEEILEKKRSAINKQYTTFREEKDNLNKMYPDGCRLCAQRGVYFD